MMTMMNTYINTIDSAPIPEWIKAERYDYCEPMIVRHHRNFVKAIKSLLAKLFNQFSSSLLIYNNILQTNKSECILHSLLCYLQKSINSISPISLIYYNAKSSPHSLECKLLPYFLFSISYKSQKHVLFHKTKCLLQILNDIIYIFNTN